MTEIFRGQAQARAAQKRFRCRGGTARRADGRRLRSTAGVRELAGRVLGKQVRLGRPQALPGLAAATAGPAYSTVLGLLLAGATNQAEINDPNPPRAAKKVKQRRGLGRFLPASFFE